MCPLVGGETLADTSAKVVVCLIVQVFALSSRTDPALVTELKSIVVNVDQLLAATHHGRDCL